MEIRDAKRSDQDAIKALIFYVLKEYGLPIDEKGTDKDLDDIERYYWLNGGHFSVVEDEKGKIIASVAIAKIDRQVCELRKMYIYPSARGAGLGEGLLQKAFCTARELGYTTMMLETASCLKEAIALYEKHGFKRVQQSNASTRCDQCYSREI